MTTATLGRSGIRLSPGLVLMVGAIAASAAAPLLLNHHVHINPQIIARFGYPAIFVVCALGSLTLFLPVPGLALVFAASAVLDPFLLALAAGSGMALGILPSFFAGRKGAILLEKLAVRKSPWILALLRTTTRWMDRVGATSSFALATIPNPLFDFAGIIAGSLNVPLWRFALGTFGGKVLQAGVVAAAGRIAFAGLNG